MSTRPNSNPGNVDRRSFIMITGASVTAAILGCNSRGPKAAKPLLELAEEKNEIVERALFRHSTANEVSPEARVAGGSFPKYYISRTVPVWDESTRGVWRLEVSGAVKRPLSFSLDELMKLPSVTQKVDHFCVEGWNARAEWTGVRVSEIAKVAGLTPDAQYADFQSFDSGYHESWDMDSAMHRQTLITYGMDGKRLSSAHGAPARLHSPIKLGYKNTKYLTKIVFMPKRNGGYWTDQGYEWYAGT
jgi:DMSO/TMAO reductase YedYZ molybdopterin-dependent catalytic subunit